jgi:hypothetical protein
MRKPEGNPATLEAASREATPNGGTNNRRRSQRNLRAVPCPLRVEWLEHIGIRVHGSTSRQVRRQALPAEAQLSSLFVMVRVLRG